MLDCHLMLRVSSQEFFNRLPKNFYYCFVSDCLINFLYDASWPRPLCCQTSCKACAYPWRTNSCCQTVSITGPTTASTYGHPHLVWCPCPIWLNTCRSGKKWDLYQILCCFFILSVYLVEFKFLCRRHVRAEPSRIFLQVAAITFPMDDKTMLMFPDGEFASTLGALPKFCCLSLVVLFQLRLLSFQGSLLSIIPLVRRLRSFCTAFWWAARRDTTTSPASVSQSFHPTCNALTRSWPLIFGQTWTYRL